MVIVAPPIQRMAGMLGPPFSNNPKANKVRNNTRPRHECAFSFRKGRRRVGDSPAHEKMRDRTHSFMPSYEATGSKSNRRMRIELGITCSTTELLRRLDRKPDSNP